ncbi:hypothetical protein T4B_3639 [Trichinella pseudospiralis]|nr:hypothetical protein T4B_3639 [Trichinella pseudospiralis]KRZ43133.1 hypothetical protein T4C_10244 [Trichinella pseudospiralis]
MDIHLFTNSFLSVSSENPCQFHLPTKSVENETSESPWATDISNCKLPISNCDTMQAQQQQKLR